jgi:hypothetical protein
MSPTDWSRQEVEAIVDDYLSMLASELAGVPYNKSAHRRALRPRLNSRSEQSIEFKHGNISAVLIESGFPYLLGYKQRSNYQALLVEVVLERVSRSPQLHEIAAADADRPMVVPEVDDILKVLTERPKSKTEPLRVSEAAPPRFTTNYLEREARNRSLGAAGELFVINFERARLISAGREALAGRIEHTAQVRGDHEGFDILSFDVSGEERLIEVKTTKYGVDTPFFVSRNEVVTSERRASRYQLYRLFAFRKDPGLYVLPGAISGSCVLSPSNFLARPQ